MKRGILIMIFSLLLCSIGKVQASEIYYTTESGINLTEEEYNYILEIYSPHQLEILTENMYNIIHALDFENNEVRTETYEEPYTSRLGVNLLADDYYETNGKKIGLTTSCFSSYCLIIASGYWKKSPNVRSWDVMGSRLKNTYFTSNVTYYTSINSSAGEQTCTEYKYFTNGVGCSMKLPTTASDIAYIQSFTIEPYGMVYSTYQHAINSVSLATSKRYSMSISGYGNVLLFDSAIRSNYDAMGGVSVII